MIEELGGQLSKVLGPWSRRVISVSLCVWIVVQAGESAVRVGGSLAKYVTENFNWSAMSVSVFGEGILFAVALGVGVLIAGIVQRVLNPPNNTDGEVETLKEHIDKLIELQEKTVKLIRNMMDRIRDLENKRP